MQVAEQLLFHWKCFPIALPPTITDQTVRDDLGREKVGLKVARVQVAPMLGATLCAGFKL